MIPRANNFKCILTALAQFLFLAHCFGQGMVTGTLQWACDGSKYNNGSRWGAKNDSILVDFFSQIERSQAYDLSGRDTFQTLLHILSMSKDNQESVCLLPFLRMFDTGALFIYKYDCFTRSDVSRHWTYCRELPVRYIILFFLQAALVKPIASVQPGYCFGKVYIRKSGGADNKLTEDDYNELYGLYMNWVTDKYLRHKRKLVDPLRRSRYKWVIEFEKRKTLYRPPNW